MKKTIENFTFTVLFILSQLLSTGFATTALIPVTKDSYRTINQREHHYLSLHAFAAAVEGGNPNHITGIFVPRVLAQRVVRQPKSDPAFVSSEPDSVTQFNLANKYGSLGFLAHNYLSGVLFFNLQQGDVVYIVYGDGSSKRFKINEIRRFKALKPNSPYSDFIDLNNDKTVLPAKDLFFQTYGQANHIILQTCIEKEGNQSWGRLFVMAEPIENFHVQTRKTGGTIYH